MTEREARINFIMFLDRLTCLVGGIGLNPTVSVSVPPPPAAIYRIDFNPPNSNVIENKTNFLAAPLITNQPNKIILTDLQLDELNKISLKIVDGSLSVQEAILDIRGGRNFKDFSYVILFILLYKIHISGVEGFQTRPPHLWWVPNRANPHHPYSGPGGYGSSNLGYRQISTYLKSNSDGHTETQMSRFLKDKKVNLTKCLEEVRNRAPEIGCKDFECSLERFRALSIEENGLVTPTGRCPRSYFNSAR